MDEYVAETLVHHGLTIKIVPDDEPESPREWSNLGTMICFHRRYTLGDEGHGYNPDNYDDMGELLEDIKRDLNPTVVLPLYLMDHSGISMSTSAYSCPWDSGQVGWIMDSAEGRKELGIQDRYGRVNPEEIRKFLEGEVETYSQYLEGDVYGYVIEGEDGETLDSCWGYYGTEDAIASGKEAAEHEAITLREARNEELAAEAAESITYAWNG